MRFRKDNQPVYHNWVLSLNETTTADSFGLTAVCERLPIKKEINSIDFGTSKIKNISKMANVTKIKVKLKIFS